MYFYFYLVAMYSIGAAREKAGGPRNPHRKPRWEAIVTTLQISQMFVGIAICSAVYLYQRAGFECDMTQSNFVAGLVMYASYALLFLAFAAQKYVSPLLGGGKAASAKAE